MNYVWELMIKALQQEIDETQIHFNIFNLRKNIDASMTHSYKKDSYEHNESHVYAINPNISPYVEVSPLSMFQEDLTGDAISKVDVNPYIRFIEIFYEWLSPDIEICTEFSEKLADVIMHYLAHIDMKSGMTLRAYYIKFIENDMTSGIFGDGIKLFSLLERRRIACEILNLYITRDYMSCAKRAIKDIFPFCQILLFSNEEIIFYMRMPENTETNKKIKFIIKLFMPLNIKIAVHWQYTYGIIDCAATAKVEGFIAR